MITPLPIDLLLIDRIYRREDLSERLAEVLRAVAQHHRAGTVTITYKAAWDEESQRLNVTATVKSKRPVKVNRNEEVLGDEDLVLTLKEEIPGQETIGNVHAELRAWDKDMKDRGVSMEISVNGKDPIQMGKRTGGTTP